MPCTTEIQLLQKMNQLYHAHSKGTYRVTLPNTFIIKLILTPDTPKAEKTGQNSLCYGSVSYSYQDRIHLFSVGPKAHHSSFDDDQLM